MKYNKANLVDAMREDLAQKGVEIPKVHVEMAVDSLFQQIMGAVEEGVEVTIKGFGTFTRRRRKGRLIQAPNGVISEVPTRTVPYFKPGKGFRERVNR